jgi:streptomycin 6-kinase
MDLRADTKLPFPRAVVFAAYRDRLQDMLAYLPNVRKIEVRSREEEGNVVRLVNFWQGGGEIPAAARAFVSEAMLSWLDYATWDAAAFTCAWRIEPGAMTEAITCKGLNTFAEVDGGTVMEIRGELVIDPKKLRGVPGFLAGTAAKAAEDLLASKIRPNLVSTADGVTKWLTTQGA